MYSQLDSYSQEIFSLQEFNFSAEYTFLYVIFPPINYNNKLLKGLYFCNFVDVLNKFYPDLHKFFNSIESSMWCSYPKAQTADAYFTLYKNEKREEYFRQTFPEKSNIKLIPLQESDYTNDKYFTSGFFNTKPIDVLMITRFKKFKNIGIFVEALKIYEKKYRKKLNAVIVDNIPNHTSDYFEPYNIDADIPDWYNYVQIIPSLPYYKVREIYRQSKVYVFTSLLEGSNRSIKDAVLCNVPVITFKDYNKEVRGETPIFPADNISEQVEEFSASELAEKIHFVLCNLNKYSPRKNYLKYMNRKIFADTCLKFFDEYKDAIYENKYDSVFQNKQILDAVKRQYKFNYEDFLYDKKIQYCKSVFYESGSKLLEYYMKKYSSLV